MINSRKSKSFLFVFVLCLAQAYNDAAEGSATAKEAEDGSGSREYIDMSDSGCGLVKVMEDKSGRIVNGNNADFGEFPWQVALRSRYLSSRTHHILCGGSLISDQWIVTAAHCFSQSFGDPLRGVTARLGEYDFLSDSEPLTHVDRNLTEIIVHPNYKVKTFEYDVALLKMDRPVKFQMHVQPICLHAQNISLVRKFLTATGWGRLFEDGRHPAILQDLSLPVLKNKDCEKMFIAIGKRTPLKNQFICAGFRNGKLDTCSGDSGGPLQMRLRNGRWVLAGITSWGFGCGKTLRPGLSFRVSYVSPWIKQILSEKQS